MAQAAGERVSIIDKIRKLLALAHSSNENEAALALERAHELLAKYNLNMFEVGELGEEDKPVKERHNIGNGLWCVDIYNAVAKVNYCRFFIVARSRGLASFVGRPVNIEAARESAKWLVGTLDRLAMFEVRKHCPEGVNKLKYRNSWLTGAVGVIVHRLEDTRARETVAADTQALVVMLDQELNEAVHRLVYLAKGPVRHKPDVNSNAYVRGQQAGQNIPLAPVREIAGANKLFAR